MIPEMMMPATAGKVFDGGCHCGAVRFRAWYDSSANAERGFCGDRLTSLFYWLHTASVIAIAPGMFEQSDQFEVAGQIYTASHLLWGHVI